MPRLSDGGGGGGGGRGDADAAPTRIQEQAASRMGWGSKTVHVANMNDCNTDLKWLKAARSFCSDL